MLLRTYFVVYAALVISATSPLSAEVAYISDCNNNASVVGVFQTTNKEHSVEVLGKSCWRQGIPDLALGCSTSVGPLRPGNIENEKRRRLGGEGSCSFGWQLPSVIRGTKNWLNRRVFETIDGASVGDVYRKSHRRPSAPQLGRTSRASIRPRFSPITVRPAQRLVRAGLSRLSLCGLA
jgi:hypothetical protein